jgi:hypothetical protein
MRGLSIRQPWAHLIVHGVKDIENRTWATTRRGVFLIHASSGGSKIERERIRERVWQRFRIDVPPDDELAFGGIIGCASVVDVVERSNSPWFTGPYGLVLRAARPLPFRRYSGRLGFFEVRS